MSKFKQFFDRDENNKKILYEGTKAIRERILQCSIDLFTVDQDGIVRTANIVSPLHIPQHIRDKIRLLVLSIMEAGIYDNYESIREGKGFDMDKAINDCFPDVSEN